MSDFLEKIEDSWYLDSKLEKNIYFYHNESILRKIMNGRKFYIIGRKGTGKTAISEYIIEQRDVNIFTEKLTFKNFPFNELYELSDDGFNSPNQYITMWKFVIYSNICRMMINSNNTPQLIKKDLERLFDEDIKLALSTRIKKWTGANFDLEFMGAKLGVGSSKEEKNNPKSWIDKVNILEKFISEFCSSDDKYIISFDELDEDYKDMINKERRDKYSYLLTGLFKAIQDIHSVFDSRNILPVIFIRDDIYSIIKDPDKTKWNDFAYILEWEEDSIKTLLAFRLSKVVNYDIQNPLPFNKAWGYFFTKGNVSYGNKGRRSLSPFEYITKNTFLRPRDYVKYLQVCAEKSLKKGAYKITPEVVKMANKEFSNHLRNELIDEIHSILPDIEKILSIFSQLRKQTFSIDEFKSVFNNNVANKIIESYDVNYVLKVLFDFSIIGNQPKQKSYRVFKYKNKDANLNLNEKITIHQGLFRALQIV